MLRPAPALALQALRKHTSQGEGEDNRGQPALSLLLAPRQGKDMRSKREKLANPACHAPGCKGRHIRKLHELLKDMHKEENQVHLVQGDDEWEESEDAWAIGEGEEAMIVGTIQQEDDGSWQEASNSWLEQDGEEESRVYCVGTCQGVSSQLPEAGERCSSGASCSPEEEDEEIIKDGWWSPDLGELQIEKGEKEYFIELLMSGSALGGGEVASERPPAASSTTSQPAKKEVAPEPMARNPKEARGSKLVTSKGMGRNSGGAPKEMSEPNTKTGEEEAGTRSGEESGEWRLSGRGQEVLPDPPGDPGPRDKKIQAQAQSEALEHKRK